jgi:hypothetical protein
MKDHFRLRNLTPICPAVGHNPAGPPPLWLQKSHCRFPVAGLPGKYPQLAVTAVPVTGRPKQMKKPPPIAPKVRLAAGVLSDDTLQRLSTLATYEGSVQHKDTMSFAGSPDPRKGATAVGAVDESADCMLCPRKWSRQQGAATELLRFAIRRGQFRANGGDAMPHLVWARDPVDRGIVYEARRLSWPEHGFKAYPLTRVQTAALEFDI